MLGLGGFDLDTGLRVNFTTNLEDSLPRWNPADGQLVFSSTRYGDGRERVYTVWPDGRSEAVDLGEGSDPDWSPDGARLVYKGCDAQGANCGLWTMGQDGSDRRALTDNAGDARPRWSPDGSRVVFMSDQRDGNWDVYSVAIESGEVTRITFNPALDGIPAISPDGAEIVFLSNRGDRWGIWRVSIDSGRAQSIVGDVGALPNWLDESMDWVR
jgi:Tol biopolymer transport system component